MAREDEALRRLRAALDQLAAQDASQLLAEARTEARARVRATLADALTESLLEATRLGLEGDRAPRVSPSPPPAPRVDAPDLGTGWYVYCVTSADGPSLPAGVAGVDPNHGVRAIEAGELSAVVSAVALSEFDEDRLREHLGDMAWVERVARRHEEVLDAVSAGRTVVPMRMCTIYRDETGVQAMLTREDAAMKTALGDLEGRSEWGVKLFAIPGRSDRRGLERRAAATSGAAYMEQRQREQRERGEEDERRNDAAEAVFAHLDAIAVRAAVIAPQRPEVSGHPGVMLLNSVYLISHEDVGSFHDAVGALQDEYAGLGLELQVTGPWPAYNFVPDAIGSSP